MGAVIYTYGQQFVTPLYNGVDSAEAKRAVALKASTTFARGTILGELTGTGTFAPYVPKASWTAANEVDTLTLTATGGTYQLVIQGEVTPTIAFNAVQATIQTAVNAALAAIPSAGTVTVSGTGPFVFTFGGAWAGTKVDVIEPIVTGLTGGGATMVQTTAGATGAPTDGTQNAQRILPFDCITDASGNITKGASIAAGAGQYGITELTADVYSSGIFAKADLPNLDANAIAQLGRDLGNGELLVTGS